ncbi:MAG: hypothetical protein ACRC62_11025, partial [Microcoleus sp.]
MSEHQHLASAGGGAFLSKAVHKGRSFPPKFKFLMTLAGDFSPNSSNSQDLGKPEGATSWDWQNWEGLPYLTCSLLAPWKHGFFTQQFSPRGPI